MISILFSSDWRLGAQSNNAQYIKILLWFLDSNTAPFSIHRIALLGKQYDKEIGEWFGPSTISQVLRYEIQTIYVMLV